jgi:RsiW-degrading membrane proteinase PrsW (M82 family)
MRSVTVRRPILVRLERSRPLAVAVALFLAGVYWLLIVLNALRPRSTPGVDALLSMFSDDLVALPGSDSEVVILQTHFWAMCLVTPVAAAALVIAMLVARSREAVARWSWWAIGTFVAPFAGVGLALLVGTLPWVLLCAPSTAIGLAVVLRFQRFHRTPTLAVAAAFLWGLVVASSVSALWNTISAGTITSVLVARVDPTDVFSPLEVRHDLNLAYGFLGPMEELSKGAGVLLVYVLARSRMAGVMSGVVLGAAAGLGFNTIETAIYMSGSPAAGDSAFQYWMRQWVGLLTTHTLWTALVGAGIAIAVDAMGLRSRLRGLALGMFAGMGCHAANNVVVPWLTTVVQGDAPGNAWWNIALVRPSLALAVNAPMVIVLAAVVAAEVRLQRTILLNALHNHGAHVHGITKGEIELLLDPPRRQVSELRTLLQHGLRSFLRLRHLNAVQYDVLLALPRTPDSPTGEVTESHEGDRVRTAHEAFTASTQTRTEETVPR